MRSVRFKTPSLYRRGFHPKTLLQNLTMRMSIRSLTQLANYFSRKVENLEFAIVLWFANYNFVRPHRSLKTVPAINAGVFNMRWSLNQLLENYLAKS